MSSKILALIPNQLLYLTYKYGFNMDMDLTYPEKYGSQVLFSLIHR